MSARTSTLTTIWLICVPWNRPDGLVCDEWQEYLPRAGRLQAKDRYFSMYLSYVGWWLNIYNIKSVMILLYVIMVIMVEMTIIILCNVCDPIISAYPCLYHLRNICTSYYNHYQIEYICIYIIKYSLELGRETMVYAVCLAMFLLHNCQLNHMPSDL